MKEMKSNWCMYQRRQNNCFHFFFTLSFFFCSAGEFTIGRLTFSLTDKFCSRKQALIQVDENGEVILTPVSFFLSLSGIVFLSVPLRWRGAECLLGTERNKSDAVEEEGGNRLRGIAHRRVCTTLSRRYLHTVPQKASHSGVGDSEASNEYGRHYLWPLRLV